MNSVAGEAPGRLELLRRFVNTVDLPDGADELATLEAASAWCRANGLASVPNRRELERMRGFREAVRDVLSANNGEGDRRAAWEALGSWAQGIEVSVTVDPQRGPVLVPSGGGAVRSVAAMLTIVYDAVAAGTWQRLRACRKSACRFAYYDRSKNGSRAWCSMATCGNREKAQRRRLRERDEPH